MGAPPLKIEGGRLDYKVWEIYIAVQQRPSHARVHTTYPVNRGRVEDKEVKAARDKVSLFCLDDNNHIKSIFKNEVSKLHIKHSCDKY